MGHAKTRLYHHDRVPCTTNHRWFEDVRQGKYVVVVVVSEVAPTERHWIITAYMTRRVANGEVEWQKD